MVVAQTAHFGGVQTTVGSGFSDPTGTAVDASGNIYVSDALNHAVKEIMAINGSIPASPTIQTLWGGFIVPTSVAVDGKGNVYVADDGNGTIKQMIAVNGSIPASPAIITLTTLSQPQGVAVDAAGNVYVSGGCNGSVPAGTRCGFVGELLAVNGVVTANSQEVILPVSPAGPGGAAVDANGNVFVTDTGNKQVDEILAVNGSVSINSAVRILTTLSGKASPGGIAVDNSGNVFVTDVGNNLVDELLAINGVAGNTITTLGTGFNLPAGLASDSNGNLYVADLLNNRVVMIAPSGANFGSVNVGVASAAVPLIFTFDTAGTLSAVGVLTQGAAGLDFADAHTGSCTANTAYAAGQSCTVNVSFAAGLAGSRAGAAVLRNSSGKAFATGYVQGTGVGPQVNFLPGSQSTVANITSPYALAVDASGSVYAADSDGGEVYREIPGSGGYTQQGPIGSGMKTAFGVATDAAGDLYIVDTSSTDLIYKEAPLSSGYAQSVINLVAYPHGIGFDGNGNTYILGVLNDSAYCVKAILTSSGYVQTATIPTTGTSLPGGFAVDSSGNLYIADTYNGRVIKETSTPSGYIQSVVAGGLGQPQQIAVDGSGNIYIADAQNAVVLKESWTGSGYSQSVLSTSIRQPFGIAVDGGGNVYVGNYAGVVKLDYADPPALSFTSTSDGTTTNSSTQTETVENTGNAALQIPLPTAGSNPNITGNFTLDSSGFSSCPVLNSSSFEQASLAAGATCQLSIHFAPTGLGASSGTLALTDNNLNAAAPGYASQTLTLNGTQVSPTFTLSSSVASGGLQQGSSLNSTITVTPQSGYTVNASLSASGLPSGVTAAFTTNPTTGSSVLTLTASSSATIGPASLTITGSFGTQTATTSIYLSIVAAAPSFSLSDSPASLAVAPGSSATSTLSVAGQNGFSGSVMLAASGLPSGVTASFSPSVTTSTSALTLSAGSSAAPGVYSVAITGTSGSLTATTAISLTVKTTPSISWATPAAIGYGTALSATQLNASSTVAGAFTYSPAMGAVLGAGPQTLTVTFTPNDSADYASASATVTQTINQAVAAVTWATPAAIGYGTALSATQLNASSTVAGAFTYSPAMGAVLGAGPQTLTVTFTPTDTTDYTTATATVTETVNQATPVANWATPAAIGYGTALSAAQLNASSNVAGTFTYSPAAGAVPTAGPQTLTATFLPTDATDYTATTATVVLTVTKATPAVSWATPAAIPYGTALSAAQLNASSTTAGTFAYSPAAGTVLGAGPQTLTATFTPTDATDVSTATSSVTLTVSRKTPAIAWATPAAISYGTALSAAQLNATSTTAGTFAYSPAAGTVLGAGPQTLTTTFTPTDATDVSTATSSVTLTVNRKTPAIAWATPAAISYGTALSATQLNATSTVSGTFIYSPAAGTVPAVGTQVITATFTPADTTDYNTATANVSLVVNAAPSFTLAASPASVSVTQSASSTSAITVTGQNGFTGSVSLAASGLPPGVTASFSANPTTGTSTMTLTASSSAAAGSYTVTVKGTSGSLTASATVALTVKAAASGFACHVGYTVSSQWPGGFGAALTINNTGTTAISNWTLTWTFANGQTVTQIWNGNESQSGANVTVTNLSYNGSIPAGGSYTGAGFNGNWNNVTNAVPTSFSINGTVCR